MKAKMVTIALILLFTSVIVSAFRVNGVWAGGAIYIRADGSIDPPTAPITSSDNITYFLTDNINGSITVERANTIIDGGQHILQGEGYGINVTSVNNVTVRRITVVGFDYGIWFYLSSNSTITENVVTKCNWNAVALHYSVESKVTHNNITHCHTGIMVYTSFSNTLSNNNITNSHGGYAFQLDHFAHHNLVCENSESNNTSFAGGGIYLAPYSYNNTFRGNNITDRLTIHDSPNNTFFHNNLITRWQVMSYPPGSANISRNIWDDGYPSGGNYWRDYNGTDVCNGFYQNDAGSDGIGDLPWIVDIEANNIDHYPLMGMFHSYNASLIGSSHTVDLVSNSTISDFAVGSSVENPEDHAMTFYVIGESGTAGFCRILIPTALMNGTYTVLVNGTEVAWKLYPGSNSTHRYLYFNYTHSTQLVIIVPESPSFLVLPIFMIVTFLAVLVSRRKHLAIGGRQART